MQAADSKAQEKEKEDRQIKDIYIKLHKGRARAHIIMKFKQFYFAPNERKNMQTAETEM